MNLCCVVYWYVCNVFVCSQKFMSVYVVKWNSSMVVVFGVKLVVVSMFLNVNVNMCVIVIVMIVSFIMLCSFSVVCMCVCWMVSCV